MTKRRLTIKKILISLGITLLFLIILGVGIYQLRVPIAEFKYTKETTAVNLIKLSILLIETNDYEKMTKYLPMAVDLDNFIETSDSNKLYLTENQDKTSSAEDTYKTILVENALSYICAEKYDDFHEKFPELYKKIILFDAHTNWIITIEKQNKITKEGYENIIKALNDNSPPLLNISVENADKIREYAICLILKISVYDKMGDKDNGTKLYNEYQQLMKDLDSIAKK